MDIIIRICILAVIIIIADKFIRKIENFEQVTFGDTIARLRKHSEEEGLAIKNDSLFQDVIFYDNDENLSYSINNKKEGKTGLEKCLAECDGRCIEFGVSGNANCFPRT